MSIAFPVRTTLHSVRYVSGLWKVGCSLWLVSQRNQEIKVGTQNRMPIKVSTSTSKEGLHCPQEEVKTRPEKKKVLFRVCPLPGEPCAAQGKPAERKAPRSPHGGLESTLACEGVWEGRAVFSRTSDN